MLHRVMIVDLCTQVDSYEGRLAQANATYVRARSKYERAAKANSAILVRLS